MGKPRWKYGLRKDLLRLAEASAPLAAKLSSGGYRRLAEAFIRGGLDEALRLLKEMERNTPTSESRFYRDLFGYLVLRDDVVRIFLSRKAEGNLPLDVYSAIYSISISRNADLVIRSKERVMSFLRENLGLMKALPDQLGEYVVVRVARGRDLLRLRRGMRSPCSRRALKRLLKGGFPCRSSIGIT